MSIGRLVVELELRDGQFHASMRQAQNSVTGLSNNLTSLSSNLNKTKSDLHSTVPHLRDIAIVSSSAYSIISSFNETIGALGKSLIKSNAEIEKTTILLQGLSKSIDIKDKAKDAQRDLSFLLDTAKTAPFSLKELSNAFVKMRTVGLDDVESKLKSLTNSIAKFGGSDETLHRSTVAIQQMASKGVISMEELRQQLGESIPNAMNMMSDGMGMSMSSLTQKISEGRVKALPAIRVMLQEMEFNMRGSSEKMMDTWNGMTSQLATNWMLLQKKIGDVGIFDSAKGAVKSLNDLLKGDEALKYAGIVGDGIGNAIDAIKKLSSFYDKHTESIQNAGKALLAFWAITKTISGITSAGTGISAAYANIAAVPRTLSQMSQNVMTRRETQIIPMSWGANTLNRPTPSSSAPISEQLATRGVNTGAASLGRISEGTREVVRNTGMWQRALGLSGVALAGLMSPLGQIGILAAAVAYQFGLFDTKLGKAKEGLKEIIEKQQELDKIDKMNRVEGDIAIKTKGDLLEAQKNADTLKGVIQERKSLMNQMNSMTGVPEAELGSAAMKNDEFRGMIQSSTTANLALFEGKKDLYRRVELAAKASQENIVTLELAARTTNYKAQADFINKGIDLEKQGNEKKVGLAKKTNDEIDKIKEKAFEELHRKEIQETINSLNDSINLQKKAIEDAKLANPTVKEFSLKLDEKGNIETQINETEASLSLLRSEINNTSGVAEKADIAKKISDKEGYLDELKGKLTGVKGAIDGIFKSTTVDGPDWDSLLNFPLGMQKLAALTSELERFMGMKKELNNGIPISEEALISGNTDKKSNADRDKLIAKWQSALESFTEKYSKYADPYNKSENVSSVDVKDPKSVQKFLDIFFKEGNVQTLSQRIINGESGGDYNAYNRGIDKKTGKIIGADRAIDFTSMTIADVLKMERDRGTPNFVNSVGKYQMVSGTLEGGAKSLGLDINKELLSPEIQDRIMNEYIIAAKRPVVTDYLSGKSNDVTPAMGEIRKEFTSLQSVTDKDLNESLLMLRGDTQRLMNQGLDAKGAIAESFKASKLLSDPSKMSSEEIKAQTIAMNALKDAFVTRTEDEKNLIDAQKSLTKQQADTKNQQDRRNGVPENKIPATMPEGWYKNNEEIDKRKKYGTDYSSLVEQNKIIEQEAIAKKLAEDAKKTYEIKKSIDEKEIHNAEAKERALQAIQDTSNDALRISEYELNKDIQSLYDLDVKNFTDTTKEKLVQSGQAMTKEGRDLAQKLTNDYEETKRNKEKIAALNAQYSNDTDIAISRNSRGSGTSLSKDMFSAEQNYTRDVYNTISDAAASGGSVSPEKLKQDTDILTAKYKDSTEQIKYNHRNAFEIMTQEELDFHQVSGDIAAKFVTDFSSGFADMVVNGKQSFGELVVSVIKGIAQMMIQLAMMKMMQASLMFMGLASGGVVGGGESSGASVAPTPNVVMAKYGGVTAFASGGSMTAKRANKETMLAGGVKNEPHVALFAEAGIPEAFIPMQDRKTIPISITKDADGNMSASVLLPKGRAIPASIKHFNESKIAAYAYGGTTNSSTTSGTPSFVQNSVGGSFDNLAKAISNVSEKLVQVSSQMIGGGETQKGLGANNISISINVNSGGGDNTQSSKKNDGANQGDVWAKMADNVRAIVVKTLIEEKKQGGIIFNNGG